jgi:hypothetical protein
MYELMDNGTSVQLYGNAFLPELITSKIVVVEGDLVCNYLCAPQVTVVHGSLLAKYIDCPRLDAEILGVFVLDKAFTAPEGWSYVWLRPCRALPQEADIQPELTIARVAAILRDPAIVRDTTGVERMLTRMLERPTCARARVLIAVTIEELMDTDALTPLGTQVLSCIAAQPKLPAHWRY